MWFRLDHEEATPYEVKESEQIEKGDWWEVMFL